MNTPDHAMFFDAYRRAFGAIKRQEQVQSLIRLLDRMTADQTLDDIRDAAYLLATVHHETAQTYEPVREAYWQSEAWRKRNLARYWPFYGRGYVQITWRENYARAGAELGLDLIANPDLAMDAEVAYRILSNGMRHGWFSNKCLGDYITRDRTDYAGARRIVNGTDRAAALARYAGHFERCLGAATFSAG